MKETLINTLGPFEWNEFIMSNGYSIVLPDVEWICAFIMLCIAVFYLIKGVYSIIHLFN